MRGTIFILFVLLCTAIFTACKKDAEFIRQEEETLLLPFMITAGDTADMLIVKYDTAIYAGSYETETYDLDVDQDQVNDLQLQCYVYGSPGTGQVPGATIECLHKDIAVLVRTATDTSFVNTDSSYSGTPTPDLYITHTTTCNRISAQDTIEDILQRPVIIPLKKGSEIHNTSSFDTSSYGLGSGGYSTPSTTIGSMGDTTIYESNQYLNDCYNFPADSICYIGFECKGRLGWLKINRINDSKTRLIESGIQR